VIISAYLSEVMVNTAEDQ